MEKEQCHLIKIAQQSCENETWFQEHKLILNLQSNTNDVYKSRGRVQEITQYIFLKTHYWKRRLCKKVICEQFMGGGGGSLTIVEVKKIGFQNCQV